MDQVTYDSFEGIAVILNAIVEVVGFQQVVDAIPEKDIITLVTFLEKYS